jgi:hypothetical protein
VRAKESVEPEGSMSPLFEVDVELEPAELARAWQRSFGRLFLPVNRVPRLRGKTVARLRVRGQPGTTALLGTVVSAHRDGSAHRIQLAPDAGSLRALDRLYARATGAPVSRLERPPRYSASVPAVVDTEVGEFSTHTVSVSSGGCSFPWTGPAPAVGRPVRLWLGDAAPRVLVQGVVCWSSPPGRVTMTGLALALDDQFDRATWTSFLEDVLGDEQPWA